MNITRRFALATLLTSGTSLALSSSQKSSVPPQIVGQWRWSSLPVSNYEKTTARFIEDGGGMSSALSFTRDGRYTFNFYRKSRTGNLVIEANTYSDGTVTWSKRQFVLHPASGHYLSWYGGKKKTNRDMTAHERHKTMRWYYKWQNQDGKRVLVMGTSPAILCHYKRDQ